MLKPNQRQPVIARSESPSDAAISSVQSLESQEITPLPSQSWPRVLTPLSGVATVSRRDSPCQPWVSRRLKGKAYPGFSRPKVLPQRGIPNHHDSIPHVSFIEFNLVLSQQAAEFILSGKHMVLHAPPFSVQIT